MKFRIGLCALAWLVAHSGYAGTISPSKANGDFLSGTGIPNGDFTISTAGTGESVGLRVRSRDTGLPLSEVGNKYYVLTGNSALNPTQPWWEFDYQFSPGAGKPLSTDGTYDLTLRVDFDPSGGAQFATVTGTAGSSPDLIVNPMNGTWSTNAVTYVDANSLNLGFSFWNNPLLGTHPAYNANTPGEYEIDFTVSDHTTHDVIASTTVFAEVSSAPAPPSIVLLGAAAVCGGVGQIGRRLRRR
jgi:hypothetical protein